MALYKCIADYYDGISFYKRGEYYDLHGTPSVTYFSSVAAGLADSIEVRKAGVPATVDLQGDYKVEQPVQFTKAVTLDSTLTQTGAVTFNGLVTTSAGAILDGAVTINDAGAATDTRIEGDTDTNLFFVDASTDRIGISTATPATLFHVNGATTLDGATVINEAGADADTRIEGDTDPNLLHVDAGNDRVGISTGTPRTLLDVVGNTTLDGAVVVNEAGADQDSRVEGTSDPNLLYTDAGNNRVGVGTSSPAEKLDVNGNVLASTYKVSSNVGTPANGVTAVEYGDGFMHHTVLTIAATDGFVLADNAALCDGLLLYTLPAGQIVIHSSALTDVAVTAASTEIQADSPDLGLGTTEGTGAFATLDAAAAGTENILTGQTITNMNGSLTSKAVGTQLVIADGDAHTVYLNIADTWADDTGGDLTADVAGTVYLVWSYLGNPA